MHFDDVPAEALGRPGDCTGWPAFWQGGAGIAACWWDGARAIGQMTADAIGNREDPHA